MKRLVVFGLFSMVLLFFLSAVFVLAATRGIRVKAKTSTGAIKDIPLYSDYYALVIGCSAYRNGWPPLPHAVRDAQDVAKALRGKGWKVKLLDNPDSKALQNALTRLVAKAGRKKDRAVFLWYSGHGYTTDEADGTPLGYIVPVDAPLPGKDLIGFMEKAVNMRRMETVSKGILSRHVLMMFDSCFSGAIFALNRAAPSPYIQEKVAKPVREFITAGSEHETVPDRSVFKTCFLQGIEDGYADLNGDGFVTGEELGAYLQEKVVNYTRKAQHPQYGKINNPKLDKGDFVILAGGSVLVEKPSESHEGSLRIKSKPGGAGVWVEGRYEGESPLTLSSLSAGTYRVKVKKEGYKEEEKEITVSSNHTASVTFFLDAVEKASRLYVETDPSNATIRILNSGAGYHEGMELSPGRYELEVSKEGYETEKRWIEVSAGEDAQVSIALTRISTAQGGTHRAGETWKEPVTGMECVWVPGGCFEMGSNEGDADEKPVHEVCVDGFWMGKYEVTRGQFRKFIEGTDYKTDAEKQGTAWILNKETGWKWKAMAGYDWEKAGYPQDDSHPVVNVSWNDAVAFGKWLSGKSGRGFRLPTEAEWEYASRGGTKGERFWGNAESDACTYANIADKGHHWTHAFPCDDGYRFTAPVGSYKPNPFGLYDMLGNVWEWCGDWYGKDYYGRSPRQNPTGPSSGAVRVERGGSWNYFPRDVRAALRYRYFPGVRYFNLGFRLAFPPGQ